MLTSIYNDRLDRKKRATRRGAAVAEFAIIAPLFVFFVLGACELSRGLWAKEVLGDAARRAARIGSQPGTSSATIISEVKNTLNDNNISTSQVVVTILVNGQVADASTATQNSQISVKVALPASVTSMFSAVFLRSTSIESETVVMMRYDS
jgi:Flp pilus assembly protein TadG